MGESHDDRSADQHREREHDGRRVGRRAAERDQLHRLQHGLRVDVEAEAVVGNRTEHNGVTPTTLTNVFKDLNKRLKKERGKRRLMAKTRKMWMSQRRRKVRRSKKNVASTIVKRHKD